MHSSKCIIFVQCGYRPTSALATYFASVKVVFSPCFDTVGVILAHRANTNLC
jgi:hypothetical protein